MAFIGLSLIFASAIWLAFRQPPFMQTFLALWRRDPQILQPPRSASPSAALCHSNSQDHKAGSDVGVGAKAGASHGRCDDDTNTTNCLSSPTVEAKYMIAPEPCPAITSAKAVSSPAATSLNSPSSFSTASSQTEVRDGAALQTTARTTPYTTSSGNLTPPDTLSNSGNLTPSITLSTSVNTSHPPAASQTPPNRSRPGTGPSLAGPSSHATNATPSSPMPPPPRPPKLNNVKAPGMVIAPALRNLPLPNRGPARQPGSSTLGAPPTHTLKAAKASRAVVLTQGHSPLDWARLANSPTSDLRNLPPQTLYLKVTPSMLKRQTGRKGKDAWTVLGGRVYNITPYLPFHPGGEAELLRCAGRDGTQLFGEIHPWVNYEGMLASSLIGMLVQEHDVDTDLHAMD